MTIRGRIKGVVYELIEGAVTPSGGGGGGGGGGGPTCSGVPSQADFYAFMIDAALPFSQVGGNPSQCAQDWQYSINDAKYAIDDTGVDTQQRDQKWLVLWRNPASLVGTTLTVPLRPLNVGDGTAGGSVPVGWTHPTMSYSSSGVPTVNGYGPHPMTQAGHALVAQSLALPADLASVKTLTWNTLSKQPVDAFQRADNPTTLGPNWTVITGGGQGKIVNGQALPITLGTYASVLWEATTFNALDQFSRVRLGSFTVSAAIAREIDLVVRGVSTDGTGYAATLYWDGAWHLDFYRLPGTLLASNGISALGPLDLLELKVTQASPGADAVLTVFQNQVQIGTFTDTTPLNQVGSPGFEVFVDAGGVLTDVRIETWQGGHLHGPSPTTELGRATYGAGSVSVLANLDWAIPWGSVANGVVLLIDDHADPAPTIQTYPSGGSFAQWFTRAGTLTVT